MDSNLWTLLIVAGIGFAVIGGLAMLGVAQGMKVAFIIALVTAILAFVCGLPLKKLAE